MTKEEAKVLALEVLNKAIQDIDAARTTITASGNSGSIPFRLTDAETAIKDLLGSVKSA